MTTEPKKAGLGIRLFAGKKGKEKAGKSNTDALGMPKHDVNPYMAARREWDERMGTSIAREHSWKLGFFGVLVILGISVGGNVYQSTKSRVQPYVVEVNKLGDALTVGVMPQAGQADPRVIRTQLARWIFDARTLYADVGAERQMIIELYSMIAEGSAAQEQMNEYLRSNDPLGRAQTELVTIHINSVVPLPGSQSMWRIEWVEKVTSRDGHTVISEKVWQADVTVLINAPTDIATAMVNPLGVYVSAYNWTQRL